MGIFRPQHLERVVENVIRQYLTIAFWLSWLVPFGIWKMFELIKSYFG